MRSYLFGHQQNPPTVRHIYMYIAGDSKNPDLFESLVHINIGFTESLHYTSVIGFHCDLWK